MAPPARTTRTLRAANDEFQLLRALLTNRNKRHRQGRFLVHGVRAINLAIERDWPLEALLLSESATSKWSAALAESAPVAEVIRLPARLLDELSQRDDGTEAVLVATIADRGLADLAAATDAAAPLVVAEGIKGPGNLGTILRSAEALGAAGVVVTGHAADLYDPACVRASTGALFEVPTATASSVVDVIDHFDGRRPIGLDPAGASIDEVELSPSTLLVAGTEASGLSANARARCDELVSIPMSGATASLNVATAVAIALAEIARRGRQHGAST